MGIWNNIEYYHCEMEVQVDLDRLPRTTCLTLHFLINFITSIQNTYLSLDFCLMW